MEMIKIFSFLALKLITSIESFETIEELASASVRRIPTENMSRPLDVRLGMYLESVGNFRSSEMSFDVDLYIYLSWKDERLAHTHDDYVLINDDNVRRKLWLPDLYFANARQAHFQEVTVPNFNMFVAPDGSVAYSCRCTLTVACSLDLRFYPMDSQICTIRVVSYAYIARQMNVSWFDMNAVRHNPEIGLPEFHITAVSSGYCNGTYRYAMMPGSHKLDDFSCLTGEIYLSRSIGYNLVQSYIPTGLIVMISWVSFWIDRRAVPARVTLSFTTLVSLTTLGNGLRFGLPQVSYAKAIDLWYGVCMLFVFCALLEFAIVNSYMRKTEKFDQMAKKLQLHAMRRRNAGQADRIPTIMNNSPNTLNCAELNGLLDEKKLGLRTFRFIDELSTKRDTAHSQQYKSLLESSDSRTQSIYDNVSPWKGIKQTLFSDDSDKESDDGRAVQVAPEERVKPRVFYEVTNKPQDDRESVSTATYHQISKKYSRQALTIDKMCRYGFPLVFLLWNSWYWWYYLVYTAHR